MILLTILALWIFVGALRHEGRVLIGASVFMAIGDRAIQLDRLGRVGQPLEDGRNVAIPKYYISNPGEITCQSNIVAKEFNPDRENSVRFIGDWSRSKAAYLLYYGPPPDFSRFFDPETGRKLMGAQRLFHPNGKLPPDYVSGDHLASYDSLILGRNFVWQSVECSTFTYTKFEEIE